MDRESLKIANSLAASIKKRSQVISKLQDETTEDTPFLSAKKNLKKGGCPAYD